ncbi:MAG: response regulator [Promethearchaeota archaeon]
MMQSIIVIDDEKSLTKLAEMILKRQNYNVITFNNPILALDYIKSHPLPDLVLTDMRMPQLSGPQLCAKIREDERCKDLKIAVFSASISIQQKFLDEYHIIGLLPKPFDLQDFIQKIKLFITA